MKLVVTGGAGFIGSNFIRKIFQADLNLTVYNVDKLTYAANKETTIDFKEYKNYEFFQVDICDRKKMYDLIDAGDIVVNFAAESHVDNSISNPNVFLETNVLGVQNLLSICKEKKVSRFVQISTDEVYGSLDTSDQASKETDILRPSSPYSASKAAAEMLCFAYMKTFNVPIIITRSSNNFGPYQFPEKIIPLFVTNLLSGRKVPVYGSGKNIRDWIYVEENCDAILHVIKHGQKGEVYNIGGGNEISNIMLTKIILQKLNKDDSCIDYVQDRQGHDLRYALDCSKLKALGWKSKNKFLTNIDKTVDWYIEHTNWWKNMQK